jgi:uncharacterized Fe-S cluster-containing radical SAM superfamily protein
VPVLDKCEPQVLNAFRKDGWSVAAKPFVLRTHGRNLYADFSLHRGANGTSEQIIVVEVKCFTNPEQDFAELYGAVGQYQFYRQLMESMQVALPLYMAVPEHAYERIIENEDILAYLKRSKLMMVLVDLEREVIVRWIR